MSRTSSRTSAPTCARQSWTGSTAGRSKRSTQGSKIVRQGQRIHRKYVGDTKLKLSIREIMHVYSALQCRGKQGWGNRSVCVPRSTRSPLWSHDSLAPFVSCLVLPATMPTTLSPFCHCLRFLVHLYSCNMHTKIPNETEKVKLVPSEISELQHRTCFTVTASKRLGMGDESGPRSPMRCNYSLGQSRSPTIGPQEELFGRPGHRRLVSTGCDTPGAEGV